MTRAQQRDKRTQGMLARVTARAVAQEYRVVELDKNKSELGPWYFVRADGMIIGAANTWTVALSEALEYLS